MRPRQKGLWGKLRSGAEAEPLTAAQAEELDRRVQDYREDRDPGRPWREALREIGKNE